MTLRIVQPGDPTPPVQKIACMDCKYYRMWLDGGHPYFDGCRARGGYCRDHNREGDCPSFVLRIDLPAPPSALFVAPAPISTSSSDLRGAILTLLGIVVGVGGLLMFFVFGRI